MASPTGDHSLIPSDLGSRRSPIAWVSFDQATPSNELAQPSVKRRHAHKQRKREAKIQALADNEALVDKGLNQRELTKAELQEMSKLALAETYKRIKMKREPRDPSIKCLGREQEDGNVEYKLKLKSVKEGNPNRIQQLITQMKFRLSEGNGECFYIIGVEDDGYPFGLEEMEMETSLSTLSTMASALGAEASLVRRIPSAKPHRSSVLIKVRRKGASRVPSVDLRIAISGSLDSGKSTLTAVLTHGRDGRALLDNGRGTARMSVLRHKHELESGRTSSLSQQVLGYFGDKVLNYSGSHTLTPTEICSGSDRLLTLIDMGGHEKSLKTALWSMTCLVPDHSILCISVANVSASSSLGGEGEGEPPFTDTSPSLIGRMTREHLALAVALEIPVACVLTKCDLLEGSGSGMEIALSQVRNLLALSLPGLCPPGASMVDDKDPDPLLVMPLVQTVEEAKDCARCVSRMRACPSLRERRQGDIKVPVFATSSVTGFGLDLLHAFLSSLGPASTSLGPVQIPLPVSNSNSISSPHPSNVYLANQDNPPPPLSSEIGSNIPSSEGEPLELIVPPALFQVDQMFEIHGIGSVACGTCLQGEVRAGQRLMLGPCDSEGGFQAVVVRECQRMHTPVESVKAGQTAALSLMPPEAMNAEEEGVGFKNKGSPIYGVSSPHDLSAITELKGGAGDCEVALGAGHGALKGQRSVTREEMSASAPSRASGAVSKKEEEEGEGSLFDFLGDSCQGASGDEGDANDEDDLLGFDLDDVGELPMIKKEPKVTNKTKDRRPQEDADGTLSPPPPSFLVRFSAPRLLQDPPSPSPSPSPPVSKCPEGELPYPLPHRYPPRGSSPSTPPAELARLVPTLHHSSLSSSARKGTVLLGSGWEGWESGKGGEGVSCGARREFDAVLVLLGGKWPARGLISGRWPPEVGEANSTTAKSDSRCFYHEGSSDDDGTTSTIRWRVGSAPTALGVLGSGMLRVSSDQGGGRYHRRGGAEGGGRESTPVMGGIAGEHIVVVHSGSVRQAARVTLIQELKEGGGGGDRARMTFDALKYIGIKATAAILNLSEPATSSGRKVSSHPRPRPRPCPRPRLKGGSRGPSVSSHTGRVLNSGDEGFATDAILGGSSDEGEGGEREGRSSQAFEEQGGCIVRVRFCFVNRPEWLREGSKLILRDTEGLISGAGFICVP